MKVLSTKRSRFIAGGAVVASAVIVAGGLAVAATPPNTYTGCLQNGTISKVAIGTSPASACTAGQTKISWNQRGVRGKQGPQGIQGIPGPATGPAGGDLTGSYPNPTLKAPTLVGIAQQPAPPAASINCGIVFNTFCGDANAGNFWNHPIAGYTFLGYYIEPSGFIQFQGATQLVFSGQSTSRIVLRLPPGARPAGDLFFTVPIPATEEFAQLQVTSDGLVFLQDNTSLANQVFDLSVVRFRIAN